MPSETRKRLSDTQSDYIRYLVSKSLVAYHEDQEGALDKARDRIEKWEARARALRAADAAGIELDN